MLRTSDKRLFVGDSLLGVFPGIGTPAQASNAGKVSATSRGTTVTGSASSNTKGSFTELTASSAIDADGFIVIANNPTVAADHMFDIAVGSAGSETVIVSNLAVELYFSGGSIAVTVPIKIAAGSRISARLQGSSGSATLDISVVLYKGGVGDFLACMAATTYGADTSTSTGTAITYAGSANTKGSWVELSSSTTGRTKALLLLMGLRGGAVFSPNFYSLLDVGVGSAGSETVIIPDISLVGDNSTDRWWPNTLFIPVDIPAGTRLAARAQHSGNNVYDVIAVGFS